MKSVDWLFFDIVFGNLFLMYIVLLENVGNIIVMNIIFIDLILNNIVFIEDSVWVGGVLLFGVNLVNGILIGDIIVGDFINVIFCV